MVYIASILFRLSLTQIVLHIRITVLMNNNMLCGIPLLTTYVSITNAVKIYRLLLVLMFLFTL